MRPCFLDTYCRKLSTIGSMSTDRMERTVSEGQSMADETHAALRALADPSYVAGTVAARHPGKPVLGIRIPILRSAVRQVLNRYEHSAVVLLTAADALWNGAFHEEELAACMLLRLTRTHPSADLVHRWAALLDNWLSVDELAGCIGEMLAVSPSSLADLLFLAESESAWQRRLYLASLIRPLRAGLDPGQVPCLAEVLRDGRKPVRSAASWLLRDTVKGRPRVVAEFGAIWSADMPKPLTRLLTPARH
jgi:3-methyladenine DNA glycosylase AlkD